MVKRRTGGRKFEVHIKNNRDGKAVFRVTPERLAEALGRNPDVAPHVEARLDWDLDGFDRSMRTADALMTWDLATEDLAARAPNLKWIHIIGVRRHARRARWVDEMYGPEGIDAVLRRADFVVVTTPLTPETDNLIDRRRLDLMKPGAGLINMSRARVVDYAALVGKLRAGSLAGAILDVFDPEPLPAASPLWDTPNPIVTPHVSSDDDVSYAPLTLDPFFDNVRRHLAGRPLRNRVRPRLGY